MSADDLPPEADDDLLAAELAFGLTDAAEQATGEQRLRTSPAFAAAHDRWLARALAIGRVHPEQPSDGLWERIRARLPANQDEIAPPAAAPTRWWLTGVGVAAAFVAGLFSATLIAPVRAPPPAAPLPVPVPAPQRPLVALLAGSDRAAAMTISVTRESGRIVAIPNRVEPGRKAIELWAIPAGDKPHALGVLSHRQPSWQPVSAEMARYLVPGVALAISLEPRGGSPTGQPTGPVILTGRLSEPG